MKHLYRIISLMLGLTVLFACKQNLEDRAVLRQDKRLSLKVNVPQGAENFRTMLKDIGRDGLDYQVLWKQGDKVTVFVEQETKVYRLGEIAVSAITAGGQVGELNFDLPQELKPNQSFRIIGVTGTKAWEEGGQVQIDVQPMIGFAQTSFTYPLYFKVDFQNAYDKLDVDFQHLGTCEIVRLYNKSGKASLVKNLYLSLSDGSSSSIIYERSGNTTPCYQPLANKVVYAAAKSGAKFGAARSTSDGASELFFSWFMPKEASLSKATFKASIDGKSINANINKAFNESKLIKGKAYHIGATWNGQSLTIGNVIGGLNRLRVERQKVEFRLGVLVPIETVQILSGSGRYKLENRDPKIAKATLSGTKISIEAVAVGVTLVKVLDLDTKQKVSIVVTVETDEELVDYSEKVLVKGGTFQMGSNNGNNNEKPVHKVTVKDFYIGKYEVTNEQFADFLNVRTNRNEGGAKWLDIGSSYCGIIYKDGVYLPKRGKEYYPVVEVTWYGASAYAKWVGGRLPSEAEWEYAARGGNKSKGYLYSGGDDLYDVAWYTENSQNAENNFSSGKGTHIVGKKQANELGIYDMSGNVWEWCKDTYHSSYTNAPADGSAWVKDGNGSRVLRGGSWDNSANNCRVADRDYRSPTYSSDYYGFRVCWGVASSGK